MAQCLTVDAADGVVMITLFAVSTSEVGEISLVEKLLYSIQSSC